MQVEHAGLAESEHTTTVLAAVTADGEDTLRLGLFGCKQNVGVLFFFEPTLLWGSQRKATILNSPFF